VFSILSGHTDSVNVVRIFSTRDNEILLLTGSVDKSIRVWTKDSESTGGFKVTQLIQGHQSAINCIAVLSQFGIFASGSSDGSIMIWSLKNTGAERYPTFEHKQTINITPKLLPLAISLAVLDDSCSILAVAGTKNTIQLYVSDGGDFVAVATLTGHENWIRALDFVEEVVDGERDLILASACQDKYIRLWRVHEGVDLPTSNLAANDPALGILGRSLSNKAHRFTVGHRHYSLTFEALLIGHEDWIYTANWNSSQGRIRLLSASADNSLAIWEADPASGIWICTARLGEISSQKGSTTATGSTGGFWIGLWSSDGDAVVSLGRTGSWRLWNCMEHNKWEQAFAVTGHTKEVKDITWSKNGDYLLSTSSDQTTRLHALWKRDGISSWHEISRPQIHGYDLNCIDSVNEHQFISGADEKLLRVFDEPTGVALFLRNLSGIQTEKVLPDAATIPVLGLSNKAVEINESNEQHVNGEATDDGAFATQSTKSIDQPPLEDYLSRHLLWPETEKLYGHGYEISCVAASHDGKFVATACRASSIDHALIRLYDTSNWLEIKPALRSHSLTVTRTRFSHDDKYLLSVGRDRQWTVFERDDESANVYKILHTDPKGHGRMILDCSWVPKEFGRVFATAGRDKLVKVWNMNNSGVSCLKTITEDAPITALSFTDHQYGESLHLAYGMETGSITVCILSKDLGVTVSIRIGIGLCPSKTISRLMWQPVTILDSQNHASDEDFRDPVAYSRLAIASDDTSVRILTLSLLQ